MMIIWMQLLVKFEVTKNLDMSNEYFIRFFNILNLGFETPLHTPDFSLIIVTCIEDSDVLLAQKFFFA